MSVFCVSFWGIIPARAGFTRDSPSRSLPSGDHPRSRGVYNFHTPNPPSRVGSSPLARGLHMTHRTETHPCGIIPARAGFTRMGESTRAWLPDHPRSRGVYYQIVITVLIGTGSSPLARGLRIGRSRPRRATRIIPARAGFTRRAPRRSPGRRDHPRSRGVYVHGRFLSVVVSGSSPLARGLREGLKECLTADGIIPARAGFTFQPSVNGRLNADHPRSRGVYL